METLTLNEFNRIVDFKLDPIDDQQAHLHIVKNKTGENIGTIDITGENIKDMERKAEKCKLDHFNFFKALSKYDDEQVDDILKTITENEQ